MICLDCYNTGKVELPAAHVMHKRSILVFDEPTDVFYEYKLPKRIDACRQCADKAEFEYQILKVGQSE